MARNLQIPFLVWIRLIRQLRSRGDSYRESGAFLLGRPESRRIARFICYDDLDPTALDSGIVMFHGVGFARLWDFCRHHKVRVIADVHTHPNEWTGQSGSDRTHPMIGVKGHVSLIVPHYAQGNIVSLTGVGMFEYLGEHEWRTCADGEIALTLI